MTVISAGSVIYGICGIFVAVRTGTEGPLTTRMLCADFIFDWVFFSRFRFGDKIGFYADWDFFFLHFR